MLCWRTERGRGLGLRLALGKHTEECSRTETSLRPQFCGIFKILNDLLQNKQEISERSLNSLDFAPLLLRHARKTIISALTTLSK